MILNIFSALLSAVFCMFISLAFIHVIARVPYDQIVVRPHLAASTAVSISIAIQYQSTFTESMLCFVGAIIGCYFGQVAFAKAFDPKFKQE